MTSFHILYIFQLLRLSWFVAERSLSSLDVCHAMHTRPCHECVKTWEQINGISVHTKLREGKGRWLAHGWSYGWEQIYSTPFTLFSCNQPIVFFPCTKPATSLPEVFFSHSKSVPATASRTEWYWNDALWLGYRSLWLGYRLAELAQGRDDDSHQ